MSDFGASASPVVLTGLVHRYGSTVALDGVSLTFAAGSSTAIIGPDGVGKSTLLGLLVGVRRLQTGEIAVFGGDMRARAVRDAVAPRVAYMPQGLGRNLYPSLSVAENIDFHARLFGLDAPARAARVARLLAATGLDPFPDRPAGQLSGGMKQKLSLCCALVHDPDLLVLDEPTTGVDPLSRRQFWDLIDTIRRDRPAMTVIVATAYMDEAARFDRVIAISDGRVVADGPLAEILAETGAASLEDAYRGLGRPAGEAPPPTFVMPPRPPGETGIAIEAAGLTRRFGDFTAVDHVSFRIAAGEIFGFLGSNGCGKTTTMKMLTGLLAIDEGTASLLGKPVDAADMTVRLRVGYVSQSFSLWEELTVRANLVLHARLYRVEEARVAPLVAEALARFDLLDHADDLPGKLPLGIRQRLQLAAACLHAPEVLILDEPTSGVDPQARDDFWRHLAKLSREDGVTIFVSTHFMNEAERCDRISLMHRGRVLAIGAPADLVREAGVATLEDAFVLRLEEAGEGNAPPSTAAAAPSTAPASAPPIGPARRGLSASAGLVWAFARREGLEILRDRVRLTFAVAGSLLLLVLFAFGVSFDVEHLPFAVLDRDQSIESTRFVETFRGSRHFSERAPVTSEAELDRRLTSGELRFVVSIPPNFGADLLAGRRPEVGVAIDGANTFRAETVKGYLQGALLSWVARIAADTAGPGVSLALPFDLETRLAYNQAFVSVDAITPGVIMLLLVLIPSAMTAVGVAREREIGSIANFEASPASVVEFLIGKQLPYVAVGMVSFATLVACARLAFGVPFHGSAVALTLGALLYVFASTAFGLLVSTLVRTQVAAIMAAAILSVIPTINFSGFINPMSSIEGFGRVMGLFFPASWFQTIAVGSFAKGVSAVDLLVCDAALLAFGVVFIALAALVLEKQEA